MSKRSKRALPRAGRARATAPPPRPPGKRAGPSGTQIGFASVVAILAVAAFIWLGNMQPVSPAPISSSIRLSGTAMGEANAPVTIEEWADFQCPACRTFAVTTEPQLRAAYVSTGKVRFIFQNFAFLGVESEWAAQAAECAAAEGRFVDYHDRLYAAQRGENSGAFSKANLKKIGVDLGLGGQFTACVDSGAYAANVRDSRSAGQAKGVRVTPTLFINGTKVEGALTFDQLRAKVDPLLR